MAAEIGIPVDQATKVLGLYYRMVRESVSTLSHTRVHLTNLGDLVVKHWLVDKEIQRYESALDRRILKEPSRQEILLKIKQLRSISQQIEEEKQRKDFIHNHKRKDYETNNTSNLEK